MCKIVISLAPLWNVIITEFSNTTLCWHVSCRRDTCQHKVVLEKNVEVLWLKSLLYFVVFCCEFLFHRRFSWLPYTLKTGLEWHITFHALLTHMLLNVLNFNKMLVKWLNKGTFLDCTLQSIYRLWSGVQSLANLWCKYFYFMPFVCSSNHYPLLHGVWSNQLIHLLSMRCQAIITTPSRLQPTRLIAWWSNGNIFRVTGHLCGEFTSLWWIPRTKASNAELWCFLWSVSKSTVEKTIVRRVIWDAIAPIMTSL